MAKKAKKDVKDVKMGKIENETSVKESFAKKWFREYATANAEELKMVCDLTTRSVGEQFSMHIASNNTETFGAMFYVTFLTILDVIRRQQNKYNNFTITIMNSINIGYTNNDDEDNEKQGNFMPLMEYVGINRQIVDDNDASDYRTEQNFIRWQQLNAKKNVEYLKEIQEAAYARMNKEYCINARVSEAVIPIFCIFLDNVVNVLKMKYKEAIDTDISEVSMNVFGLFDIFYSFDEESNKEVYEYQPNIATKLALKSDNVASRD